MTVITTFAKYILKIIKRRSYVVHDNMSSNLANISAKAQ
jgi:hypothetical protein